MIGAETRTVYPASMTFGPDGNLYVGEHFNVNAVTRFNGSTGAFIDVFVPPPPAPPALPIGPGVVVGPSQVLFGPDGRFYVVNFGYVNGFYSSNEDKVARYNGSTGAFVSDFVTDGSGGLDTATAGTFGPDGNFYAAARYKNQILRYNGTTGAFMDVFATGGDNGPVTIIFRPDYMYVLDQGGATPRVLRFNRTTGAFVDSFVTFPEGEWPLTFQPQSMSFGPHDGNIYITFEFSNVVMRFNGTTGAFIDQFVTAGSGGLDFPDQMLWKCFVTSPVCPPSQPFNATKCRCE
jgi:hypothetical protein